MHAQVTLVGLLVMKSGVEPRVLDAESFAESAIVLIAVFVVEAFRNAVERKRDREHRVLEKLARRILR